MARTASATLQPLRVWLILRRLLGSGLLWLLLAMLVYKTAPYIKVYGKHAATDFLCIYYGAKLLESTNIYDWQTYRQGILADPEYPTLPPIPDNFKSFAPAPPPLYPPSSFYILKPLVWLGFTQSILLHRWLMPFFALLTAWGTGVLAAQVLRRIDVAPIVAAVVMSFYLINEQFNSVLYLGQLNVYVAAGLVWSVALAAVAPMASSILFVLIVLLKPSGWLLGIPFLWLWYKKWKAMIPAAVIGLALCVLPGLHTWQAYLQSSQTGTIHQWLAEHVLEPNAPNSALKPIAALIGGSPTQIMLVYYGGMVLYLSLWVGVLIAFMRKKTNLVAIGAATMLVSFLLGPISWNEHLVFLVPFLLLSILAAYTDNLRCKLTAMRSLWWALGGIGFVYVFCFSCPAFPAGALGRLNVLIAKPWHCIAAAALLTQGISAVRLLMTKHGLSE